MFIKGNFLGLCVMWLHVLFFALIFKPQIYGFLESIKYIYLKYRRHAFLTKY